MTGRTAVFGHRGAPRHAPENTLPSFRRAVEVGADGVEFDVQLSRDGELVVIHDETLERTTDGRGLVADHTFAELRRLDASVGFKRTREADGSGPAESSAAELVATDSDTEGLTSDDSGLAGAAPPLSFYNARIPALAEVLELLAPTPLLLNVELKNSVVDYPGLEEKVLAALDRPEFTGRVVLSSFNLESVRRLGALGTPHRLAALFEYPSAGAFGRTVDVGATAIHPPSAVVWRRGYVRRAHRLGLAVRPWVVNRKSSMGRMFRWGVDGIFTDLPDVALRIRTDT